MHVYAKDGDYVTPKLNFLNLFMTKKYSDIIMNRKTKENYADTVEYSKFYKDCMFFT